MLNRSLLTAVALLSLAAAPAFAAAGATTSTSPATAAMSQPAKTDSKVVAPVDKTPVAAKPATTDVSKSMAGTHKQLAKHHKRLHRSAKASGTKSSKLVKSSG